MFQIHYRYVRQTPRAQGHRRIKLGRNRIGWVLEEIEAHFEKLTLSRDPADIPERERRGDRTRRPYFIGLRERTSPGAGIDGLIGRFWSAETRHNTRPL